MQNNNDNELEIIKRAIKRSTLFSSIANDFNNINELAIKFQKHIIPKDHYIIKQGEDGDKFYIIEDGECDVIITTNDGIKEIVAKLNRGNSFGEMALLSNTVRNASVITTTPCRVWSLDRDAFQLQTMIQKKSTDIINNLDKAKHIIASQRIFNTIDDETLKASLIQSMFMVNFEPNEVIVQYGQHSDNVYIIEEGKCAVVDTTLDNKEEKTHILVNLQPGDLFGFQSVLMNSKAEETIIAKEKTKVWAIDRSRFRQCLLHGSRAEQNRFNLAASVKIDDKTYMTINDLLDSIGRHNLVEEFSIDSLNRICKLFPQKYASSTTTTTNNNNNELIDFHQYLFMRFLLTGKNPELALAFRVFDSEENGRISRDEFIQAVETILQNKSSSSSSSSTTTTTTKTKIKNSTDQQSLFSEETLEKWFGKNNERTLTFAELRNLLEKEESMPIKVRDAVSSFVTRGLSLDVVMARGYDYTPAINERSRYEIITDYFSGGVAGAVSRTVVAPLERLKILFMVGEQQNRNVRQALINIWKTEGFVGLFKGNGANVLRIFPYEAVKLGSYTHFKHFYTKIFTDHDPNEAPSNSIRFMSGVSAGLVSTATTYPLDLLRARMSLPNAQTLYPSIMGGVRTILKSEGIIGFYHGLGPTLLGIAPYAGVQLTLYDILKRMFQKLHADNTNSRVDYFVAGSLASGIAQTIAFPLEFARRRIQVDGFQGRKKYTGFIDVMRKTVQSNGVTGLWRGLLPNYLKIVPSAGTAFLVYENCKSFIMKYEK